MTWNEPHLPREDYRDLLKSEFNLRQSKNKNYSLRSFARDLNLDPGNLSKLFAHKKNLSLNKAMLIAKKLFDNPIKSQAFYHTVEISFAENSETIKKLEKKIQSLMLEDFETDHNINLDEFETISEWYHLPILESLDPNFYLVSISDVAKYFDILPIEAHQAIKRLERLGFAEEKSKLYRRKKSIVTSTNVPSFAIRHYHLQMIEKSKKALLTQPLKYRHNSGLTIKIQKNKINEFKKAIHEFEDKIAQMSQTFGDSSDSEVYQFNTQLFSLKKEIHEE